MRQLVEEDFKMYIRSRADTIYERLKQQGVEPVEAFRRTPHILQKELSRVMDDYWQWDSDWK